MARKEPTPATIKALFAKSGNRCSYSNCTNILVDDLNIFVGELAHIHAVRKKDARFDASKSDDDLRHYDNLMLMCHPHHKRVDTREDLYSADTLRNMKAVHETNSDQSQFAIDDSVLAQAALEIVQEDWVPYLDSAVELLYDTLEDENLTQSKMNHISANVAEITDAQLFVIYTRLFQALLPADQLDLYREQDDWRIKRQNYAETQVASHGGTMASLDYSIAFFEFTKQRIDELSFRLNHAESHKSGK